MTDSSSGTTHTPVLNSRPRVRFAPSPTGYLHVGGARTALFNWLFARRYGGTLVLRVEDTDLERSTSEMVEGILQGMRWLGLDWDEGPFFQTQRMGMYREAAAKLVVSGHAYHCFCTKEELERRRAAATAAGRPPKYDGTCRRISASEVAARLAAGAPAALRFAVPESGATAFDDAVFGRVEFANAELEDFVLLRSDGGPTYHISVVTDDVDMRITHVIRGADHISNTPKQVLLYNAMGAPLPVFAHVPLILGAGQDSAQQAAWRDQRDGLSRRRHCARGVPEFSGAAGMDSAAGDGRDSGRRGIGTALRAGRDLAVQCGF
jgi:glutamyl-tRNA synthetase